MRHAVDGSDHGGARVRAKVSGFGAVCEMHPKPNICSVYGLNLRLSRKRDFVAYSESFLRVFVVF